MTLLIPLANVQVPFPIGRNHKTGIAGPEHEVPKDVSRFKLVVDRHGGRLDGHGILAHDGGSLDVDPSK